MAAPIDAPVFGSDICLCGSLAGTLCPSEALADLLVEARENYAWPRAETAAASQQRIVDLETETRRRIVRLDAENAHWIVQQVSRWGRNKPKAQRVIDDAPPEQKSELASLITQLLGPDSTRSALHALTKQPGVGLVMATKIYRFCCPDIGAAVDRHSSYFFNSLQIRGEGRRSRPCTQFKRQWENGKRRTSRLAVYYETGCSFNLNEYLAAYLPLIRKIADLLNAKRGGFVCAASRVRKLWRTADVEMAAYYWWSKNITQYR
jgi:hypothetical protein